MCGRVALFTPPSRLARFLEATLAAGIDPEGHPSWNIGPQRRLFAVSDTPEGRVLDRYRWGLVPSWAKEASIGNKLFNARGETVAEKPSFRAAFAKRTCVIPVDGFYEWDHRPGGNRQPHYFSRRDGDPLLLAGLYEHWHDPQQPDGPVLATCTVITTEPGPDIEGIHDRMPVVVEPEDVAAWLGWADHPKDERLALIQPAPGGTLAHHGVSTAVGSVKNDGPELVVPEGPGTLF